MSQLCEACGNAIIRWSGDVSSLCLACRPRRGIHSPEPWRAVDVRVLSSNDDLIAETRRPENAERIVATVNFCAGARTEVLKPGMLVLSFRPLADGTCVDVLTLSTDYERAKAENKQLRAEIARLKAGLATAIYP